jgi:hypothetical protein
MFFVILRYYLSITMSTHYRYKSKGQRFSGFYPIICQLILGIDPTPKAAPAPHSAKGGTTAGGEA